jgi:hypothetical protein
MAHCPTMPTLAAHGIAVSPPSGWDAQIFRRDPDPLPDRRAPDTLAPFGGVEAVPPIAHVANFGLPPQRGDFGGGAVELMGTGAVFISLLEHTAEEATTALFAGNGIPWPFAADDFSPDSLQRGIAGQAGLQRFFVVDGRAFCLYVVIGSYRMRGVLVREVNDVLATFSLS